MEIVEIVNNDLYNDYKNIHKLSEVDYFFCDGSCDKTIKKLIDDRIDLYSYMINNHTFIYCEYCLEQKSYLYNLDFINYMIYSEKEKPRDKKCSFCDEKLGGGCKWYYNYDIELYICKVCYKLDLNKKFKLLKNTDTIYLCDKNKYNPVIIQRYPIIHLCIPDKLKINSDISYWLKNIENIVYIDNNINNICYWLPFTVFYNFPEFINAVTFLLINCSRKNGEVASVLIDKNNRVSVDIIYNDFESYTQDYEKWNTSYNNSNNIDKNKILKKIISKYNETQSFYENELCKVFTEFSAYIRIHKKLKTYYG